mmetsp:Transcript_6048/g.17209  ORF Transcript_6048/g.17209 Transcript_6048/m.17209 type:complete len:213 (-) Transcript_6048:283-921(-)
MNTERIVRDRWSFVPPDGIDQIFVTRNQFPDFQATVVELFLCYLFHSFVEFICKRRSEHEGIDANPKWFHLCFFAIRCGPLVLSGLFAQVLNDGWHLGLSLFDQTPQRRIQLHVGFVPIPRVRPEQGFITSDHSRARRSTESRHEFPSHVGRWSVFTEVRIVGGNYVAIEVHFFHFGPKHLQLGSRCHGGSHDFGFLYLIDLCGTAGKCLAC